MKNIFARWVQGVGLVAFSLMLCAGCGSDVSDPVVIPERHTENKPDTPAISPATVVNAVVAISENAQLVESYEEYRRAILAGDAAIARSCLDAMSARSSSPAQYEQFWRKKIPEAELMTLRIMKLCDRCTDGRCAACDGGKICKTCEGKGICLACKGQGGEKITCAACLCPECKGAGYCTVCKGRRYLTCPQCKGKGIVEPELRTVTCAACGGSGKIMSKMKGSTFGTPCTACNGRGTRTAVGSSTCPKCGGLKGLKCEKCNGSGICPVCRRTGHKPGCKICNGAGWILRPCAVCHGKKVCPDCQGSKLCAKCQGDGVCRQCQGQGCLLMADLPVSRFWLSRGDANVFGFIHGQAVAAWLDSEKPGLSISGRRITPKIEPNMILWVSEDSDFWRFKEIIKQP